MKCRTFDVLNAGLQILDSLLHLGNDLVDISGGVDLLVDHLVGCVILVYSDAEEDLDVRPEGRLLQFVFVGL